MAICRAEAAAIEGSASNWICEKICTGKLGALAPARKSARLMSLNEMMKAKTAPVTRLDLSNGSVTLKNACGRLAPRLIAASSSRGSIPARPAVTQRMT